MTWAKRMRTIAETPTSSDLVADIDKAYLVASRAEADAAKLDQVPDAQAAFEQTAERHYRLARSLTRDAQREDLSTNQGATP